MNREHPRRERLFVAIAILLLATGCSDRASSGSPEPAPVAVVAGSLDREQLLGPFLASYWQLPVPPQGPPPQGWTAIEGSLAPDDCGSCHPTQHQQWKTSLHAGAYSPGFSGQLVEGSLAAPADVRQCQTCHTPLSEQQPHDPTDQKNASHDPELRKQGIVCASCHVREHQRFGPPRRPEVAASETAVHDGFTVRSEFAESRFCAECHQFFGDPGVNGKPIQNTYAEWRDSPSAAEGRTCQSCHMPDRTHLWRGIHDPEMVRAAVEVELHDLAGDAGSVRAEFSLHSRAIGHAFPTYVTPRVFLAVWQEDTDGHEIDGTRRTEVVGREVDFGSWQEVFDTRIPPGGSHVVAYDEPRHPDSVVLAGQVRVDPDFHYRGVFQALYQGFQTEKARAQMEEAHRRSVESVYVLQELRRPLE